MENSKKHNNKEVSDLLSQIKRKEVLNVPNGYFDNVENQLKQIPQLHPLTFSKEEKTVRKMLYRLSVAAVLIAGIALASSVFYSSSHSVDNLYADEIQTSMLDDNNEDLLSEVIIFNHTESKLHFQITSDDFEDFFELDDDV